MLELYIAENCPYCAKVRLFMEEVGVSYVVKPVSLWKNTPLGEELKKIGGKIQVPFLVDQGNKTMMYESEDIINYVKKNYLSGNHP